MTRLGMAVTLVHPPEYALPDDIPETARENVRSPKEFDVTGTEGGGFELLHCQEEALKDALAGNTRSSVFRTLEPS